MPAFVEPLKRLLEKGHQVDIVILSSNELKLNIGPEWLKKVKIFRVDNWSFTKLFPLYKIIRRGKYDFIYGQGSAAGWGNMAAILARKPCGVRFYGTFLTEHLNKSRWKMFSASPLEALTHNLPKTFMIITNDGTKGDLVNKYCQIFKKQRYAFKFWLNGVDKTGLLKSKIDETIHIVEQVGLRNGNPFLFYPARYDSWKRQDLAIEILNLLKSKGYSEVQLLCCGHIHDQKYYQSLEKKIERYQLHDQVKLVEALPKSYLNLLFKKALSTFSLYNLSNLGNILIEAAISGAIIITRNDGTTDFLIKHNITGFTIESPEDAVDAIISLLTVPGKKETLSGSIQVLADSIFETWEERADKEISLIERSILGLEKI
jgi:glycosyltransferase involved in cell wall biosynthesis